MIKHITDIASSIAAKAFSGKLDKVGKPYIFHCNRVLSRSLKRMPSTHVHVCAILHDLVEGCEEWDFDKLGEIFPKKIVDTLRLLTKNKGEKYGEYIARVGADKIATIIKISDLEDNMDITRLKKIEEKDLKRLKKYHESYMYLKGLHRDKF